jgi:hypothetical protein
MASLKKILLGASAMVLPFISSGQNFSWGRQAYDVDSMKFSSSVGGIDEKILNKHEDLSNAYYFRALYQDCDMLEKSKMFFMPGFNLGRANYQGLGMAANIEYSTYRMDSLENVPLEDVDLIDESLKKIMMDFSSEDFTSLPEYERCKKMYETIMTKVNVDENSYDAVPIQATLSGQGVVCRDLAPMFYSLFNRYGIKTGIAYARADSVTCHTWLRVDLDSASFDLDPTWYRSFFVPLEKRFTMNVFNEPEEIYNHFFKNIMLEDEMYRKMECEEDSLRLED